MQTLDKGRGYLTLSEPYSGPVHIFSSTRFPICYTGKGLTHLGLAYSLGSVLSSHCLTIVSPCLPNVSNPSQLNTTQALKLKGRQSTCVPYYQAVDYMGTFPSVNYTWLCGYYLYHALPVSWEGVCAPAVLQHHTYIVSLVPHRHVRRSPFKPHDSVWCSDVPETDQLWTTGQKVMLSLFPQLGVGKVMLRIKTLHYHVLSFMNSTISAISAIKSELQGLRTMTLPN